MGGGVLGFGVVGMGLWPKTQIPNPQSPIPNPQYFQFEILILNYFEHIYK